MKDFLRIDSCTWVRPDHIVEISKTIGFDNSKDMITTGHTVIRFKGYRSSTGPEKDDKGTFYTESKCRFVNGSPSEILERLNPTIDDPLDRFIQITPTTFVRARNIFAVRYLDGDKKFFVYYIKDHPESETYRTTWIDVTNTGMYNWPEIANNLGIQL